MNTEDCSVRAIGIVSGALNPIAAKKGIQSVNSLTTMQTYALPKSLYLRIGPRYMIMFSIDSSDELVNAMTCILWSTVSTYLLTKEDLCKCG